MIRAAINGFGRIGRMIFRASFDDNDIDYVAINDLTDTKTLANLLKYDTVHGKFPGTVEHTEDALIVNGKEIKVLAEKDPENLPWDEMNVDVAVESTGFFTSEEGVRKHLKAGASKALLSAPAKKGNVKTIVRGVNDDEFNKDEDLFLSNASCTTNCLAPMVKILNDKFGIEKGLMTTIHSYTSSQNIVDGPHKDLRRARHAAENLVPTTTGAAIAVTKVMPELEGKLDGMAVRAPTPDGSLTDFTVILEQDVSVEDVNNAFREAAEGHMEGVVKYEENEVVSSDIIDDPHSCIFDSGTTMVQGNLVKICAWYDNEWGYSNRMVDMIKMLGD